jgi:hypothetical protein
VEQRNRGGPITKVHEATGEVESLAAIGKAAVRVPATGKTVAAIMAIGRVETPTAIGKKVAAIMMRATGKVVTTTVTPVITAGMVRLTTVAPTLIGIPTADMAGAVGYTLAVASGDPYVWEQYYACVGY